MIKKICCFGKDKSNKCGPFGGLYFLGFLGSVIYYLQNANTFGQGVLAFLKAFVWPVFVVHKILGL